MDSEVAVNLQKAIVDHLRREPALNPHLGGAQDTAANRAKMRLYDAAPAKPVYPFASIGSVEFRPDDQDARKGHRVSVGIEVADRPADRQAAINRATAGEIAALIVHRLHRQETGLASSLTTDGSWWIVECRYETMSVSVDTDNLTTLVVAGFTFLLDED